MSADPILTLPDERLRRVADAVTCFDRQLAERFERLEQSMRAGAGGVGIAAPQIGDLSRMIVVDCRASRRPCANHGLLLMANPQITAASGERLGREGCLSVPDWVGMVPRAAEIELCYDDPDGRRQTLAATGFEARVIQHEIDHLDGILFIDRIVSSKQLIRRMPS